MTTRTVTDTKLRHTIVGEKTPDLLPDCARTDHFLLLGAAFVPYMRTQLNPKPAAVGVWFIV